MIVTICKQWTGRTRTHSSWSCASARQVTKMTVSSFKYEVFGKVNVKELPYQFPCTAALSASLWLPTISSLLQGAPFSRSVNQYSCCIDFGSVLFFICEYKQPINTFLARCKESSSEQAQQKKPRNWVLWGS
jgi:hypothetical protein